MSNLLSTFVSGRFTANLYDSGEVEFTIDVNGKKSFMPLPAWFNSGDAGDVSTVMEIVQYWRETTETAGK